jgi:hypothetical protein
VDARVQVLELFLKPRPVLLPFHPVHSGGRFRFEPEIGLPQQIDIDMVEQRGELLPFVQFRGSPYTLQPGGHACPARRPAHVGLARVPLGPCPPVQATGRLLAPRPPPTVARLRSGGSPLLWQGPTSRPDFSWPCIIGYGFRLPDADQTAVACGRPRDLPVPVQGVCAHARVSDRAGSPGGSRWRPRHVAFRCLDGVGTPKQTYAAQ